jgi:putative membrane protein
MQTIGLPITILSLGIFYIVVNTLLLYIASGIGNALFNVNFVISDFFWGFLASIIISIVSAIMNTVFDVEE